MEEVLKKFEAELGAVINNAMQAGAPIPNICFALQTTQAQLVQIAIGRAIAKQASENNIVTPPNGFTLPPRH